MLLLYKGLLDFAQMKKKQTCICMDLMWVQFLVFCNENKANSFMFLKFCSNLGMDRRLWSKVWLLFWIYFPLGLNNHLHSFKRFMKIMSIYNLSIWRALYYYLICEINIQTSMRVTLQKKEVYSQLNAPANTLKFAIFLEYGNPRLLFPFHATLFFSLMNALV